MVKVCITTARLHSKWTFADWVLYTLNTTKGWVFLGTLVYAIIVVLGLCLLLLCCKGLHGPYMWHELHHTLLDTMFFNLDFPMLGPTRSTFTKDDGFSHKCNNMLHLLWWVFIGNKASKIGWISSLWPIRHSSAYKLLFFELFNLPVHMDYQMSTGCVFKMS